MSDVRVLMLSTIHASHARHSGYSRLAEYVPGAELLHAPRADPRGGVRLFAARVARQLAFSRWYLGGSADLEWQAARRLRAGFDGVVHSLWADHDLGFLDLLVRRRFCGTFHNCPDDFRHTLRYPARVQKFAAVVLMSECQRPFFRAAGVAEKKTHVVLHGVDTDYFTPGRPPTAEPLHRPFRRGLSPQLSAAAPGLRNPCRGCRRPFRNCRAARVSPSV